MKIAVFSTNLVGKPVAIGFAKDNYYKIKCFDIDPNKFTGLNDFKISFDKLT